MKKVGNYWKLINKENQRKEVKDMKALKRE
jgi:hypothetical protein